MSPRALPPASKAPFADVEDIRKAVGGDFLKACSSLYWINPRSNIDPETGEKTGTEGLIRFNLYSEQRIQAEAMLEMERQRKPVRILKLKCRQSGDSTFAEVWNFHKVYWGTRRRGLLVAHHETTTNALYQMAQTLYDELPPELKWPQRRFNRKELSFEAPSGSSLVAQTAGYLDIGHGLTLSSVHLSEIDRWPEPETALEGIMETTPLVAGTSIVIESVAQEGEGWLRKYWRASKAGKTPFLPLFTSWIKIPEYRLPVPKDFELSKEEQEWTREFGVTPAQIVWYRSKRDEIIAREPWGGERQMKRLYAFTEEEAFQSSGFCVFPDSVLDRLRDTVRPPDYCAEPIPIGGGNFRAEKCDWRDNALAIWQKPNPNLWYAVGVDISDGVGATESVCSVWAYPTYEQVAEWGSKHSSLEHTAWVANWVAAMYGRDGARVLMIPEVNKSGPLILYILNQIPHPSWDLYRWQYLDKVVPYASDNPKLGWECVSPDAKILTADLRWVRADEVAVGDEIMGCEEKAVTRTPRLRIQRVLKRETFTAPMVEVTLEDASTTKVSVTHPFWVGRASQPQWRWFRADELRRGDLVKRLPVWPTLWSYDAGRLSAFLDGEGHLSQGSRWGIQMLITQAEGLLADEIQGLWGMLGFESTFKWVRHKKRPHEKPVAVMGLTRMAEVLRGLGSLRPTRLLRAFMEKIVLDRLSLQGVPSVAVSEVRVLGKGEVIGLETSPDHTLIADGIVGHNTNDHTKIMLPQAFNKIFMEGRGAVRSAMLYEQMGRCVDVLPARRWRVAGQGSDRVLAALIGIMGMYVDYEGGQVQGVTSTGPAPENPDDGKKRERGTYDAEYEEVFGGLSKARASGNYLESDWSP